jgi:hypothetical protein
MSQHQKERRDLGMLRSQTARRLGSIPRLLCTCASIGIARVSLHALPGAFTYA